MKQVDLTVQDQKIHGQIPYEVAGIAKQIGGGIWKPTLKRWLFPFGPWISNQLLQKFEPQLGHVDSQIVDMANSFRTAQHFKHVEDEANLPDIPHLKSGYSAWPHQRKAFHFARHLPSFFLGMGMGTGKTLVAMGIMSERQHQNNLILCPKSVMDVWPDELDKFSTIAWDICVPKKGTTRRRANEARAAMKAAAVKKQPFVLVVNYDSFYREHFWNMISSVHWDNVIYDECHKLKAPKGTQSTHAAELVERSQTRMGLSGTILAHDRMDAFAQYRAVSPDVFGLSFYRHKQYFCQMGGFGGKEVVGYQNEQEFFEKLHSITIFIKDDVLDLPEPIVSYRKCELGKETRKKYNEMDRELYTEIEEGTVDIANAMVRITRLQQLTSGHMKLDYGAVVSYGLEKMNLFKDMLSGEIPPDEPLVVFCKFKWDVANAIQALHDNGRTAAELSGQKNQLRAWQDGYFDSIVVNISSGGVGINLTRAAYAFYYSVSHSLSDFDQSVKRICRPGQTRTVRFYHLLAEDSVDEKIYRGITTLRRDINHVIDADVTPDQNELINFVINERAKEGKRR